MKVIIYVLIDPITLKVRYIGRTSTTINQRLGTHISKAKLGYTNTHKDNWIRSLLATGRKPVVKKLCEVLGWKESHNKERSLINKYSSRLLNHDDKGEGSKNHIVSDKSKRLISEGLKRQYAKNNMSNAARKEIHIYDLNGNYISSYKSCQIASSNLGIAYSAIYKCTSGITRQYKGYQFNLTKVEMMNKVTRGRKGIPNKKGVQICQQF